MSSIPYAGNTEIFVEHTSPNGMASSTPGEDSNSKSLNVKVLSQLPEPHGVLQFPSLAGTTTVAQLKIKIRDELPSKPPLERQRLIHKGRAVTRETEALSEIFGKEAVQREDAHVIHLVIRDGQHGINGTRASPLRHIDPTHIHPPPVPNGWPPQQPTTAPFAAPANPPLTGLGPSHSNGQAAILPGGSRSGTPIPFNPGSFVGINPAQLAQQQMAQMGQLHNMQHAAAVQRQMQAGLQNRSSTPSGTTGQSHPASTQQHPNPFAQNQPSRPQSTERITTPQPQVPNSFNASGFPPMSVPTTGAPIQVPGQPMPGLGGVVPPGLAGNFTREAIGPNGQRITMTVNSNMSAMPQGFSPVAPPFPAFLPSQFNQAPLSTTFGPTVLGYNPAHVPSPANPHREPHSMSGFANRPALGTTNHFHGIAHAIESMRHYENDLRAVRARLINNHADSNASRSTQASSFQIQLQHIVHLRNKGQQMVNHIIRHGSSPEAARPTADEVQTLADLNSRFQRLVAETQEEITRLRRRPQTRHSPNTENLQQHGTPNGDLTSRSTPDSASAASTNTTQPVTAYLLYSPTGPHAVVLSPQGPFSSYQPNSTYSPSQRDTATQETRTAPSASPAIAAVNQEIDTQVARATSAVSNINREIANANEAINLAHAAVNNLHELNRSNPNSAQQNSSGAPTNQHQQQQQPNANQPNGQNQAPQHAQQVQAEEDARDILRVLIYPIFRHLWLLIRLFGFIWFLTRGGGSRRTFMIIGATMIYLAVQLGLFGDRWDRLRRHMEGLLGPPAEDMQAQQRRQEQQPQQEGTQQQQRGNDGRARHSSTRQPSSSSRQTHRTSAMPTPRDTADRLLDQRREQDRGWLRERLVAVERALALFVASLYPGVGERHVAARERAVRAAQEEETRLVREIERQQEGREQGGQGESMTEASAQPMHDISQASQEERKGKGKARVTSGEDLTKEDEASAAGSSTGVQAGEMPSSGSEMKARAQASSAA